MLPLQLQRAVAVEVRRQPAVQQREIVQRLPLAAPVCHAVAGRIRRVPRRADDAARRHVIPQDILRRRLLVAHRLRLAVEQQRRHAASAQLKPQAVLVAARGALVDHAAERLRAVLPRREAHRAAQRLRHLRLVGALERKAVARHAPRVGKLPAQQRRQLVLLAAAGRDIALHHGSVTCSPAKISFGFLICGFTASSAASVTPLARAMPQSVSPRRTV